MSKIIPVKNLLSPSKYSLKCPWEYDQRNLRNIIVHNTANDASARAEISYMISNNNPDSFHFAVDDKEVVQGIPLSKGAFSCGNRQGDLKGISIEICYSKSGGERFIKAEKLAARFIAQLLQEMGWGIDRVTKHQDYDGKYCPHRTLDMGWQRFLNMVQKCLDEQEDENMTPDTFKTLFNEMRKGWRDNDASDWSKEARDWATKVGIVAGSGHLPNGQPNYAWADLLTREQMAAMLYRFAKMMGQAR